VGLILTDQRKWLSSRWPYIAGVISFGLFCPYIIWNFQHDFAHLEFIRNASGEKYASLNAIDFLLGQLLINQPVAVFIWLPGLFAFFLLDKLKPYKILGIIFITVLVVLTLNKTSKDVYLLPAYTPLWAAGGIWLESLVTRFPVARYGFLLILILWVISTVIMLPVMLPLLPIEKYIAYTKALGIEIKSAENKELPEVHQYYADMFGWKEKARDVASVYNTLNDVEKAQCAIVASNYGRSAAIDYYGRQYGLPKAIGTHNSYWTWGTRNYTGEVVIIMGGTMDDHVDDFESVKQMAVSDCQYCMPYEDNMRIFLCRNLKVDIRKSWAHEKHYE
jgi:hypothetical protein